MICSTWLVAQTAWSADPVSKSAFRIEPITDQSLGVWEGEKPVLVYNQGERLAPGETTRFFFDVVAVANALREAGMGTAVDLRAKVRDGSVTTTSERFRFNPAIHR